MIKWLDRPEPHDFTAAYDYLSLLVDPRTAFHTVERLRGMPVRKRKAKDILRASGLELLPQHNFHVFADAQKIQRHQALSPVLLVRHRGRLIVADGYHRLVAVYLHDEDADMSCVLVSLA